MKDNRPVNLDLTTIRMPITAIASILHRISGLFVFLTIPVLLWCLQLSLTSAEQYQHLSQLLSGFVFKGLILLITWALLYHVLAGIKHLIQDLGFWETKAAGKTASITLLVLFALLASILGVLLW